MDMLLELEILPETEVWILRQVVLKMEILVLNAS